MPQNKDKDGGEEKQQLWHPTQCTWARAAWPPYHQRWFLRLFHSAIILRISLGDKYLTNQLAMDKACLWDMRSPLMWVYMCLCWAYLAYISTRDRTQTSQNHLVCLPLPATTTYIHFSYLFVPRWGAESYLLILSHLPNRQWHRILGGQPCLIRTLSPGWWGWDKLTKLKLLSNAHWVSTIFCPMRKPFACSFLFTAYTIIRAGKSSILGISPKISQSAWLMAEMIFSWIPQSAQSLYYV